MKQKQQKLYAGVWLDNQHAMIIATGNKEDYNVIHKVKAVEGHGGGSEHSMNKSTQTETHKYFKIISSLLTPYSEILLFGPGQSQEQFQHHLKGDGQSKNKPVSIESSDQLSDPQMVAKVRDFFKGRN